MDADVKPLDIRSTLISYGVDPDFIKDFLEERLVECRDTDAVMKDALGKTEFYTRETRYTKIESFIIHLK